MINKEVWKMAFIKGNGAPKTNTAGVVGDKYVDIDTGNKYECTLAYSTSNGAKSYDWKLLYEEKPQDKTPQKFQGKHNGVKR